MRGKEAHFPAKEFCSPTSTKWWKSTMPRGDKLTHVTWQGAVRRSQLHFRDCPGKKAERGSYQGETSNKPNLRNILQNVCPVFAAPETVSGGIQGKTDGHFQIKEVHKNITYELQLGLFAINHISGVLLVTVMGSQVKVTSSWIILATFLWI